MSSCQCECCSRLVPVTAWQLQMGAMVAVAGFVITAVQRCFLMKHLSNECSHASTDPSAWAAWYTTWLLMKVTTGTLFSVLSH